MSRSRQRILQDSYESPDRSRIQSARQTRRVVDNSESSNNAYRMEDLEESKGEKPADSHNQMIRDYGNFLSDRESSTAFNFDA